MWFEESKSVSGGIAPGEDTTLADVWETSRRSQIYVNNAYAREAAIEEAYDRRIDAIFNATGIRLDNPQRLPPPVSLEDMETGQAGEVSDPFRAFDERLLKLAEERPELAAVIKAERSPIEDARELVRDTEIASATASATYRGPWGASTLAQFGGGMHGAMQDPTTWLGFMMGPTGRAGAGVKGLLWMGVKQAAANAAFEAALQPKVAAWRQEAGLGYDLGDFAANVGMAGAFGFGVDVGVRGVARGIQAARGRVPILDKDGGVTGYETREARLDRIARQSADETLRKAADLDTTALRELAEETGAIGDPVVKGALDFAETLDATDVRGGGLHPDDAVAVEIQALRHIIDPTEPAPRQPPPLAEPDPVAAVSAEVMAARERLQASDLHVLEAARILRDVPQVVDRELSLATPVLSEARAISWLSDAAFEMVERGQVKAEHAALVSRLVEAPERHAGVLHALAMAEPATPAAARRFVADMITERPRPDLVVGQRIDDPIGPEAKAQVASLQTMLAVPAEPVVKAGDGPTLRSSLPAIEAAFAKDWGRADTNLKAMSGMVDAWDRYGMAGVRDALERMGPAARRDLAARLAGDKQGEVAGLGRVAFSRLMAGRALARAARALDGSPEHAALADRLRQTAAELEAEATAKPSPDGKPVLDKLTAPHPKFPQLQLPVELDGSVWMFRGEKPGQPMGRFTTRLFTTNLGRARDFAGQHGDVYAVKVPAARLEEAVPRSASRDRVVVKPGQEMFTLSETLAREARGEPRESGIEAKAIEQAAEVDFRRAMAEADVFDRMRDVMEHCKS